jgi:hypothetical protein
MCWERDLNSLVRRLLQNYWYWTYVTWEGSAVVTTGMWRHLTNTHLSVAWSKQFPLKRQCTVPLSDSPVSLLRIPCFLFVYFIDESNWCQKLKQRMILQEKSVKVKFTLEQAAKAQKGSRGIAVLFNLGARWGWVVSATPRPLYPQESPGTHCTCIAGWVGPVWTGAENLAPPAFDPRTIQLVASR